MKLIIASNNQHKISEIKAILQGFFSDICSLKEAGIDHETVEDGATFAENAMKKAREIAEISHAYALADDSGLCVDALDGAPGIYSARFAGEHGNDQKNNELLLKKLQDSKNRAAHYVCSVALVAPNGKSFTAEGILSGEIAWAPRGAGGFGYDPLFLIQDLGKTAAELSAAQKNAISHRAKALEKLQKKLKEAPEFLKQQG